MHTDVLQHATKKSWTYTGKRLRFTDVSATIQRDQGSANNLTVQQSLVQSKIVHGVSDSIHVQLNRQGRTSKLF